MIILEINKLFQEIIGLRLFGGSKCYGCFTIIVPFWALVSMGFCALLSFLYFIWNLNEDVGKASPSLIPALSFPMHSIIYWHLLIKRAQFISIFDDMEMVINGRANLHGKRILYAQTQQQVRFLTKICGGIFVFPLSSIVPFVLVAYHWLNGEYSIDSWHFICPVWTPFKVNTTYCAIAALFQFSSFLCASIVFYITLCLFVEVTMYAKTFILDIDSSFNQVDQLAKLNKSESSMLEYCKDALNLHERVYRWMNQFVELTNLIIITLVVPLVLLICISLLIVEKYSRIVSPLDLQISILAVFACLQMLFICYFVGQKLYSDLMSLSDMIYQSEWYKYPRSMRRFIELMIMRAQKPFYLSAYGLMICTLENFIKVLNRIYSAFMVLHRVN